MQTNIIPTQISNVLGVNISDTSKYPVHTGVASGDCIIIKQNQPTTQISNVLGPITQLEMSNLYSVPSPSNWKRNQYGLLENIKYEFNSDGSVNWRKLIKPEYLVLNKCLNEEIKKSLQAKYNKPFEEISLTTDQIEDKYLLILLAGIRDLAKIRGYHYVKHEMVTSSINYVAIATTIKFIGNYETDYRDVEFTALADASSYNTFSFAKNYLAAIAENRGFVRAVRNYLGINIEGFDEIGAGDKEKESAAYETTQNTTIDPYKILQNIMFEKGVTFEILINKLVSEGQEEFTNYKNFQDIPKEKLFGIIERIQKLKSK